MRRRPRTLEERPCQPCHRPPFAWIAAALLLTLLAVPASAVAEEEPPGGARAAPGPLELSPAADPREPATRAFLSEIEDRLDRKLLRFREKRLWEGGKWEVLLRRAVIRVSMWGPLGDATAWGLRFLGEHAWARKVFFLFMPLVRWMCEPFLFPVDTALSGPAQDEEMARIGDLVRRKRAKGQAVTLDNVGDASRSEEDSRRYLRYYLDVLDRAAGRDDVDQVNFSLKLSALAYRLEKIAGAGEGEAGASRAARDKAEEVKRALVTLLEHAHAVRDKDVFVWIDMEEYAYKDATLAVFKEVVEENPEIVRGRREGDLRLGIVVQAYLRDSCEDLKGLRDWARAQGVRVPVRLVKGAYERHEKAVAAEAGDPMSPVWSHKASTDAAYEGLSEFLLTHPDCFQGAFATHNIRSIARVMALAQVHGVDREAVEFQMLLGMGGEIQDVVAEMGYPMRIYVPAGYLGRGLGYAGRRFRELASGDNALTRTLRGRYEHLAGPPPAFLGEADRRDGRCVVELGGMTCSPCPRAPGDTPRGSC